MLIAQLSDPHIRPQGQLYQGVADSNRMFAQAIEHLHALERRPLVWAELTDLDWILGPSQTPMREQITDFFLRAGVKPPPPYVETLSAKVIGELVAANDRAVSIVPDDVAQELVCIAGVAIVNHPFNWTLPPITLFQREAGALFPEALLFAQALRTACAEISSGSG